MPARQNGGAQTFRRAASNPNESGGAPAVRDGKIARAAKAEGGAYGGERRGAGGAGTRKIIIWVSFFAIRTKILQNSFLSKIYDSFSTKGGSNRVKSIFMVVPIKNLLREVRLFRITTKEWRLVIENQSIQSNKLVKSCDFII